MTDPLIGKRFRTKVRDREEDDEFGEVVHPIGAEFIVELSGWEKNDYVVRWLGVAYVVETGAEVPAVGMWTIWSADEIANQAEEIS